MSATMNDISPPEFEKLRHMERFSEEMFNQIIAFQEHEHPAWYADKPFVERIKDIPLHALIFSNPDRDPKTHAHTIAPFYPLRAEMAKIATCAKQVSNKPIICDVHGHNGFLGSLLGREGAKVIGLKDPDDKPNQIESFYDADHYEQRDHGLEAVDFDIDVALSIWMPSGINRTPQIIKHKPKLIIYIHTEHVDESSGLWQTGCKEAYTILPANYKLIGEWEIARPKDLMHAIWPELTPSLEETRKVKIFADEPWHDINVNAEAEIFEPYDWEVELDMALSALQAKTHLRSQGFPV